MSREVKESVRREVTATVVLEKGELILKTTGYGDRITLDELLKGLRERIVIITIETR